MVKYVKSSDELLEEAFKRLRSPLTKRARAIVGHQDAEGVVQEWASVGNNGDSEWRPVYSGKEQGAPEHLEASAETGRRIKS